jgi:diaminopimelate epimerase
VGERFWKMTGSGNDFVVLDGRVTSRADWPGERIRAVCDRRRGVGADGLVLLTPEPDGAVRLDYFNADGGEASLCGNASLCGTRLAARLGLAADPGAIRLRTGAGMLDTRCLADAERAELRMPDVLLAGPELRIEREPGEAWIRFLTVGVPHLVVRTPDVSTVDVDRRGRSLRRHASLGPAGANVNFVSPVTGAEGRWRIRTFERGVEGETLACGTGTAAAAVALIVAGEAGSPVGFTSSGGSALAVRARVDAPRATEIWLTGEGRLVFEGTLQD